MRRYTTVPLIYKEDSKRAIANVLGRRTGGVGKRQLQEQWEPKVIWVLAAAWEWVCR